MILPGFDATDSSRKVVTFAVPVAVDSRGQLVPPNEANKGDVYICPAPNCGTRLRLNIGRKVLKKSRRPKVTYFSHPPHSNCNPDRITHGLAQRRIVEVVRLWKQGKSEAPTVVAQCLECLLQFESRLPDCVEDAYIEYSVTVDDHRYRLDVALLPHLQSKFAVEVHQTNCVEEDKATGLLAAGITYFEVEAAEILSEPGRWRMINQQPGFTICPDCQRKATEKEHRRVIEEERLQAARAQLEKEQESAEAKPSEVKMPSTTVLVAQPEENRLMQSSPVGRTSLGWRAVQPAKQPGYCIRRGEPIDRNIEYPLCKICFREWNLYKNPDYIERYCHFCGRKAKTTINDPICWRCKRQRRRTGGRRY